MTKSRFHGESFFDKFVKGYGHFLFNIGTSSVFHTQWGFSNVCGEIQLCLLFWLAGMFVLLACSQVTSYWPSLPAPPSLNEVIFCLHEE
jgi:hypothetical protein